MDAIAAFADHVVRTRFEHLTGDAVRAAKTFILDTLGVGMAGSSGPMASEVAETQEIWGHGAEAHVWGNAAIMAARNASVREDTRSLISMGRYRSARARRTGSSESQYSAPSSGNGVATMVITMADRTNEEKDLALVQELLAGPAGIMLERIEATSEGARPDFRLVSWRGFAGFCEVKSPRDDWLDEQLEQAPPLTVVGGARSDPTFNRIARNIEKAVRQFDAVNPDHGVPNVLVLVNHDDNSGFADLCETLTGQFPLRQR